VKAIDMLDLQFRDADATTAAFSARDATSALETIDLGDSMRSLELFGRTILPRIREG
jgi:hypothetical protein